MRVAVTGASGQLGTDVCAVLRERGHAVTAWTHEDLELADAESLERAVQAATPEVVIHPAAMHHVDACEADPEGAFRINAVGTRDLASACRRAGAWLMYISTDYVFDGVQKTPYREADPTNPLNAYGITKLAGEAYARVAAGRCTVLRVSGIYGHAPCRAKGLNFVDLMLKLGREREEVRVVECEIVTPTWTREIAEQIGVLLDHPLYGVVHVTANGQCSWHAFAEEIFRLADLPARLAVAGPDEFPMKVPRPAYSVLDNHRLREAGLDRMRPWAAALADYLAGVRSGEGKDS